MTHPRPTVRSALPTSCAANERSRCLGVPVGFRRSDASRDPPRRCLRTSRPPGSRLASLPQRKNQRTLRRAGDETDLNARPRGRGGGRQLHERRGGGRRGGNKATHVCGAQRRVCVAAPAPSSTEGSPERQRGAASAGGARHPGPAADRSRAHPSPSAPRTQVRPAPSRTPNPRSTHPTRTQPATRTAPAANPPPAQAPPPNANANANAKSLAPAPTPRTRTIGVKCRAWKRPRPTSRTTS